MDFGYFDTKSDCSNSKAKYIKSFAAFFQNRRASLLQTKKMGDPKVPHSFKYGI